MIIPLCFIKKKCKCIVVAIGYWISSVCWARTSWGLQLAQCSTLQPHTCVCPHKAYVCC